LKKGVPPSRQYKGKDAWRYPRETKGGAGAIVVEAAVIIPSESPYNLRISDDGFVPGLMVQGNTLKSLLSAIGKTS
jgi:hypothetical protein